MRTFLKSRLSWCKKIAYLDIEFHHKITRCILCLSKPCTRISCLFRFHTQLQVLPHLQVYHSQLASQGGVSGVRAYKQFSVLDCLGSCLLHHHSRISMPRSFLSLKPQEGTSPIPWIPPLGQFPKGTAVLCTSIITVVLICWRHCPLEAIMK